MTFLTALKFLDELVVFMKVVTLWNTFPQVQKSLNLDIRRPRYDQNTEQSPNCTRNMMLLPSMKFLIKIFSTLSLMVFIEIVPLWVFFPPIQESFNLDISTVRYNQNTNSRQVVLKYYSNSNLTLLLISSIWHHFPLSNLFIYSKEQLDIYNYI